MVRTLIDALSSLPRGTARGFRFLSARGEERYFPYEALEREARRRAAKLAALGLGKGDRVALVIPDAVEFVLSFLGASMAGLVSVPIYPRQSFNFRTRRSYSETVSHIVRSAGARMLLTLASNRDAIEEALTPCTGLERVVVLEDLLEGDAPDAAFPEVAPEDLCFLQFTSGSTALPKGVMVTHGNLVANAQAFLGPRGLDLRPDDVAVSWLPLYHDMGLIGFVLGTLICDLPTVLLPTEAFVRRPGIWMETISRYRGTITFAPNFAYALAARRTRDQDLDGLDLACLRVAGCGAEPINADVMRQFCARFGPVGFRPEALLPCYGMAEATLAITFHDHEKPVVTDTVYASTLSVGKAVPAKKGNAELRTIELVGCGHPFPGHELRIVDEAGAALPERCVGEIASRGPSTTAGYFGAPEATAEGIPRWMAAYGRSRLYRRRTALHLRPHQGPDHHPRRELLSAGYRMGGVRGARRPAGRRRGLQRHAFGRRNTGRMRRGQGAGRGRVEAGDRCQGRRSGGFESGLRRDRAVGQPAEDLQRQGPAAQDQGAVRGRRPGRARAAGRRVGVEPCAASTCSRSKTSPGVPRRCATAARTGCISWPTGTRPSTPWRRGSAQ